MKTLGALAVSCVIGLVGMVGVVIKSPLARATEADSLASEPNPATSPATNSTPKTAKSKSSRSKTRGTRLDKDTEGTEAPDRFKADTAIQSKYQYEGKPLEADPD